MLPRDLHNSLLVAQAVAFATLARSVAYDRWFTVVAAALMIVGSAAALRNRTWGVALAFASAVTFSGVWALGMAPFWFVGVAMLGAVPFLLTSDALARFDKKAAALLAGLAAGVGGLAAIAWKLLAWQVFMTFPALWPSGYVNHGAAVLAILGIGTAAIVAQRRRESPAEKLRIVEAARLRVAVPTSRSIDHAAEEESESYEESRARRNR